MGIDASKIRAGHFVLYHFSTCAMIFLGFSLVYACNMHVHCNAHAATTPAYSIRLVFSQDSDSDP